MYNIKYKGKELQDELGLTYMTMVRGIMTLPLAGG